MARRKKALRKKEGASKNKIKPVKNNGRNKKAVEETAEEEAKAAKAKSRKVAAAVAKEKESEDVDEEEAPTKKRRQNFTISDLTAVIIYS